jgi:hypothetical protein
MLHHEISGVSCWRVRRRMLGCFPQENIRHHVDIDYGNPSVKRMVSAEVQPGRESMSDLTIYTNLMAVEWVASALK